MEALGKNGVQNKIMLYPNSCYIDACYNEIECLENCSFQFSVHHSYFHYTNMSVQYTAIFHGCKNCNFQMKYFDIFLIFPQNIDRGYTLEPPQNEYPQSMF